jgi:hypothetical protein
LEFSILKKAGLSKTLLFRLTDSGCEMKRRELLSRLPLNKGGYQFLKVKTDYSLPVSYQLNIMHRDVF